MSTITQRIPNFLSGISQQPDNRKFPGQLTDCVNAFPDYALGLLKRPGGQFISELQNASTDGKWFSILRDPQEKYIAQYDDNVFRVWSLVDTALGPAGSPRAVDMGADTGVPATCNLVDLQSTLTTYNTAVTTTATRLGQLNAAQAAYAEALAEQQATKAELFEIKYWYQPPNQAVVFDQYLYTGILLDADGKYIVKNNDTIVSNATSLPAGYSLGVEVTDEYPVIASEGYRIFKGILETAAVAPDSLIISAAGSGMAASSPTNLATATTGAGTALTVDLVIDGTGVVTSATINQFGGGYVDGDTITLVDATYSTVSLEYQSAVGQAEAAMNTAQSNYNAAVTAEDTAKTAYDAEVADCAIAAIPANGYLNGATADDIELLTLNDYTFVLNKNRTVAFTADQSAAKVFEAFVVCKVVGTGHYRIYLNGTLSASHNAGSGGDVDGIVSDLASDINGLTGFTATVIGPGIHITATADFTISVVGGPSSTALEVFKDTVSTVADLPLQCTNGYKVRVVNSIDVDVDDMYVEFSADNGASGSGVWEETVGWGVTTTLDPLTMPHQLVRQANGSFQFSPVTWATRDIGDDETNPEPSFVGSTISNMFFYRNRLGFLSNESVILSRAGDYFNFFATTALTVTDDDPIDLSASSINPVSLNYVRPTSIGLVLYSSTEQFLLTTDSDILSPKTSKINELSSYECDDTVKAVGLGTTQVFISKTPLYTRVYELADISTDRPPSMYEQTQIVPELIPQTVDLMDASPALSILSMGTTGSSTVYQFRFAQQGDQRAVTTWYKWELSGTLLDQFFDFNEYYAVVAIGNEVYVQSYDVTQASETGFLTLPTGERTDVCLDLWDVNPYRTYNDGTDITQVRLSHGAIANQTASVVVLGGYIGANLTLTSASVGGVLSPTVQTDADGAFVELTGDYRGLNLITGYNYNMEVELPKFFVTQSEGQASVSDFTSDLIIHRVKVSTGLTGPVKYQVSITGRPEWNNTIEAIKPYGYNYNNVNLAAETVHTVPLYQRNENLTFKIIGDSPMPVSLLSLNWEGRYNTGFYRRS